MNPNERKTLTAWITKYLFTRGIFSTTVEDCGDKMVKDTVTSMSYYHNNEWHRTREEAVKHAEKMRKRKIASLKRSIEKIKALDFTNGD